VSYWRDGEPVAVVQAGRVVKICQVTSAEGGLVILSDDSIWYPGGRRVDGGPNRITPLTVEMRARLDYMGRMARLAELATLIDEFGQFYGRAPDHLLERAEGVLLDVIENLTVKQHQPRRKARLERVKKRMQQAYDRAVDGALIGDVDVSELLS